MADYTPQGEANRKTVTVTATTKPTWNGMQTADDWLDVIDTEVYAARRQGKRRTETRTPTAAEMNELLAQTPATK